MPERVLVVDDDETQRRALRRILESWQFEVDEAGTVEDAVAKVRSDPPSILVTDLLLLPDAGGIDLIRTIKPDFVGAIVVISAHGTIERAVEAIKEGAEDFIEKPVSPPKLKLLLEKLREKLELQGDIRRMRAELIRHGTFGPLRGTSAPMRHVYKLIDQVAPSNVSVLICGESGTGKELVARTIHDLSRNKRGPFVAINCAAIPRELIESELFGHEKGSFTGAIARKSGCFEMADHGTLFLDEISEMEEAVQAKLLRVLQEQTFRRIGGSEIIRCDVRVLAATNRDPRQAIADRKLREDLYYRLNVISIQLTPLRERREDIPLLARHFLDEAAREHGRPPAELPGPLLDILERYDWPGNARELKNALDRAFVLGDGPGIEARHLPPEVLMGSLQPAGLPAYSEGGADPEFLVRLGATAEDVERELIVRTLRHVGGNKTRAAQVLGLSLKTIHNKARKYGLS